MNKPSLSQNFPVSSSILAEFRSVFGGEVQPIYFEEGGRSAGKPTDESRYTVIAGADMVVTLPKKEDRRGR